MKLLQVFVALIMIQFVIWGSRERWDYLIIDHPNRGGYIREFMISRDLIRRLNIPLEIASECGSACTVFLSLKNLCITEDAFFVFHSSGNAEADRFLIRNYPPAVRRWIEDHGGLTDIPIVMGYPDASKIVATCG